MITALPTFAVFVGHGPGWEQGVDLRQQAGWDAHAAYLDALAANGTILLGGPLDDGTAILHLVAAADESSARRAVAADPWHRAGLLRLEWIRRWQLWLDGRP